MARRPRKGGRCKLESSAMYWQREAYTMQLFQMLRDDLINLALSRFRWIGLPDTCDPAYLEYTLLFEGAATIATPDIDRGIWLTLKAVQQGEPNMYRYPKRWRCMGATGRTNFTATWKNGVWIWENRTGFPLAAKLDVWARELCDIMQVKQINRFHMRMPFTVTGPQDRTMDVQNAYRMIAQGEPVVLGYDSFSDIQIAQTMPEKAKEYIGDKLDEQWSNTWDAIYRELGIDSLPFKEERMIESEVSSTMEPTELAALGPLEMRRIAAQKLNERFGFDAHVVWAKDNVSDNYNYMHNVAMMAGDKDVSDTGYTDR